jgi:hypothetical protein
MYSEPIYLLNRMQSVRVMGKTDSMLNVIHSDENERRKEKDSFIERDFQMVHWCYLGDVPRSTIVVLCDKLCYVLDIIGR